MAPYPTARRVKKVVNCILSFPGLVFPYKLSESDHSHIVLDRGHHANINMGGYVCSI